MERYTYFDGGKWRLKIDDTEYSGDWVDRLAAYEETGLEPEEIRDSIGGISPICVQCDGKTSDGVVTEKCGYPDDITKCLEQSKHLCELAQAEKEGRLVVLYGCAGERDAKKRPLMSEAVVKYADFAVLTSDNPRKEDPCAIIKDAEPVLAASGKPYIVEVERRTAVNRALDMLRPGDVLALCGKGHEDYQVIDGVTLYLDEHRIVREWLERKGLDKA